VAAAAAPVTPAVVRWAVEEDGRRLSELAAALKVDEDTLLAWVEGDDRPSKGQVTRLAEVLHRPRALFFLPAPPESATLPLGFRHPPGARRDASQAARLQLRRARRVQDAVSWALREREPVDLPRLSLDFDAELAAGVVRRWTRVTVEEQAEWSRSEYGPLNGWRQALDARGVLVFSIEIGRDDVRGFSSWDPWAPLIAVNVSSVSVSARVFTIGHELGHLVTGTDAACIEPTGLVVDAEVERWCESFAAAFLMPTTDVRQVARGLVLERREAAIDDVRAVMRRYGVSARAAALRLISLEYAPVRFYAQVEEVFRPKPPPERDRDDTARRPPRDVQRERQFGPRALREVLNGVPEHVALRVLRMTVDDARKIAERVPGIRADL
jgi:Zn-dependent peptidase ImmA (M78 family)